MIIFKYPYIILLNLFYKNNRIYESSQEIEMKEIIQVSNNSNNNNLNKN